MELTDEVDLLLTRNRIFVDRTRDIGVISGDEALDWGFTGPCLRACGVNYDVRKAHPYSVYPRLDFEVPLGSRGDTYDRYVLRLAEIRQSHRMILQCLEQMPPGPIIVDDWRYALPPKKEVFGSIEGVMAHFKLIMEGIQVPAGEVYSYCEGANGELGFHIVSNGKGKPYAIQVRAPGFPLLSGLPRLVKGHMVADLIPVFDSINMIGGEVEQ
ncbi:MAG TPA: NADH-quinone oxidoreductase subunit D, partial [Myxococcales bacterium]|nr:NADH-quinone oxidoreductase subunit D [Myxococcales bacterium]